MRHLLTIFATLVPCMVHAEASEPSLCVPSERVSFSCELENGKVVSLCTSSEFSETTGYLQYRYGRQDHIELEHPRSKSATQKRFELETHRPYGIQFESVNFSVGKFSYSVIRVVSAESDVPSWAGVTVTDLRNSEHPRETTVKCKRPIPPAMVNLGGIPLAKE